MKVVPDLMIHKIKRENPLISPVNEKHPSIDKNKAIQDEMERKTLELHNSAKNLKAANPGAWKIYEEALLGLYANAKEMQNSGFLHLIATNTNPEYFTMTKVFALAQIEILESILSISQISPDSLLKAVEVPIENKKEKRLTLFKKWGKRIFSR